eukprot:3110123-Amphidinium_carterae.3
MSSWRIQLNVSKTTLALSQAAREQWPAEFCNVPHLHSVRLLGVEVGPDPTGFLMQNRIDTALARLTRIRMLSLPLVLFRRLVTLFVSPVLHGVAFSVVPQEPWTRLCNQVPDMCFGKSRVLASKHLILANFLGSHIWRPDGYSHQFLWTHF